MTLVDPETTTPAVDCQCEVCKHNRHEPNKLGYGLVHAYSYKPRWQPRSVQNDPHNYYLGVELETTRGYYTAGERTYATVDNAMAADLRLPKNLWTAKHDGSVTGPEFVSQPATLAYWRKQTPALGQMFRSLLHAGFRSHEGDTCGMHVNISRTAFDDEKHLYRFIQFVHGSPGWTRKMGQRTKRSSDRWAKLEGAEFATASARKRYCARVTQTGGYSRDRYVALNAPAYEARFEFRVPRGTLRVDRFFKNLEWTVAMIEFTRGVEVGDCFYRSQFYAYVKLHESEYPNLAAFLREWFPQFEEGVD